MPDNKKHHFVPRFYLKLFSENRKSINIFNLSSRKLIKNGCLKDQCYQDYFYGKDNKTEKDLSDIENEVSVFIKDICSVPQVKTILRKKLCINHYAASCS